MVYERIALDLFLATFGTETEISSIALGSKVITVSDEFFADASNLIKVEASQSLKGQFGPKGALYDGWETRRHNPAFDWCIIKLGAAGLISGFDIDTAHFSGNEGPEASVEALLDISGDAPSVDDSRWSEILPKVPLGPNSRHLFKIPRGTSAYNYVKLKMHPDGGIARLRVYGLVRAVFQDAGDKLLDLASVFSGGRTVFVSDQHFGVGSNLLLPGRGKDMGDGWETRRSRTEGHKAWVVIQLGVPGVLEQAEIDTAHFKGNFPEQCELHALNSTEVIPTVKEDAWTNILTKTRLGPHRQHYFQLENVQGRVYTHVRITIYPDGGIKRLRVFGKRVLTSEGEPIASINKSTQHGVANEAIPRSPETTVSVTDTPSNTQTRVVSALPLTPEAFAPFGHVVQAFGDVNAAPRGIKVTSANQSTATKFHSLAPVLSCYPDPLSQKANTALSVYRGRPLDFDIQKDQDENRKGWEVKILERHPYTNQAFIPMGIGCGKDLKGEDALDRPGVAYLLVVAKNGVDDKPDLSTLRAFVAGAGQAIVYNVGIWHHPMVVLGTTMDFTCVETQIGDGSIADCEILHLDASKGYPKVKIPVL